MNRTQRRAKARKATPSEPLTITGGVVDIVSAATSEDGGDALPTFEMVAYTGEPMRPGGWYEAEPLILDLEGLAPIAKARPILFGHMRDFNVGHTVGATVDERGLVLEGVMSGLCDDDCDASRKAREIVNKSKNGYPWQASVGASIGRVEFVEEGTVEVNGREFAAPVYIARAWSLRESSFVALGADDDTSVSVAADAAEGTEIMSDDRSVPAHGEQAVTAEDTTPTAPTVDINAEIAAARAELAAEKRRLAEVTAAAKGNNEVAAKAIENGWDAERTTLEAELVELKAARPTAPAGIVRSDSRTRESLEASLCLAAGMDGDSHVKQYGERAVEAGEKDANLGLLGLVRAGAEVAGTDLSGMDRRTEVSAAFTTIDVPTILNNAMGKMLLAAYESQPMVATQVARVDRVNDFKVASRTRLLGTGAWERVAPDGELKHGTLGESKYDIQADTSGQFLSLTRQDVINDDLGAFLQIPEQAAMSARYAVESEFFTTLFGADGSSFFSAGNANYISGAGTAFSADALADLRKTFRKQKAGPGTKAKDQRFIAIEPRILLVPEELDFAARNLIGSAGLLDNTGYEGSANPHAGRYQVIASPFLDDDSTTAFYLFANPGPASGFVISALNGRLAPVIERVTEPGDMLAMQWRGYIDFGVHEGDPKGAAMSKGAA